MIAEGGPAFSTGGFNVELAQCRQVDHLARISH
jgi:hypothetical protein